MARTPNPELRSERSRRAILDAALGLAIRDGYARLTVDAIAAEAGVGKQTIYRWWHGKAAVLLEAINDRIGPATYVLDTGDIAADLTTQSNAVIALLNTDLGTVYRALLAEAQTDPRLAAGIRADFIEPRIERVQERLATAVQKGQLRADVPPRTIVELCFGPIYYRLILGTGPLDPEETADRIEALLDGLRPRG